MVKRWLLCVCAAFAFSVHSASYKGVEYSTSGDVRVNQWTSQIDKAFSTARSLGRPVLVALVSTVCSHCEDWVSYSVKSAAWRNLLAEREIILLMIVRQDVGETNWNTYYIKYTNGGANEQFPGLAIWNANGSVASVLNSRSDWRTTYMNGANFANWVRPYAVLARQASAVSLTAETASIRENEGYTGTISYSKGTENVTVVLSASDGGTVNPSTLTLNSSAGAGSANFTYTPARPADDAYTEAYTVNLSLSVSSGYSTLGTRTTVVTVKDQDCKYLLSEYRAINGNLASVQQRVGSCTWYVDQRDVLRCVSLAADDTPAAVDAPEAGLEWTAPCAGWLDVDAIAGDGIEFTAKAGENEGDLRDIKTIGVSAGDVVTFTARIRKDAGENGDGTGDETGDETVNTNDNNIVNARVANVDGAVQNEDPTPYAGLAGGLRFTPISGPSITHPVNDAVIQLEDVKSDHSRVDIAWSRVEDATDYTLYADGFEPQNMGDALSVNGVDAGIVRLDTAKVYSLYVSCRLSPNAYSYDLMADPDGLVATGPRMSFAVVDKPVFYPGIPTYITTYVKIETTASFPAESRLPMWYSIAGAPAGIGIDNSGRLYGKPKKAGTYNAVVTASNASGGTPHAVTIVVKATKSVKEKCVGFVCDGDSLVGTFDLSVSASGKATARVVAPAKSTLRGSVTSSNGQLAFSSGKLQISRSGSGLWTGSYNGHTVVARKQGSGYTGTYASTLGGPGSAFGYALATVKKGGKVSAKFMMPDARQLSISAKGIVLSSGEASPLGISMPGGAGSALFFPVYKNTAAKKAANLCAVDGGSFAIRYGAWKGAFSASLAGGGAKYVKGFGVFAGRTFVVAKRGGGQVAAAALSASSASVGFAAKTAGKISFKVKDGTYRARVKVGKKNIALKGVFVPSAGNTAAVGKSGGAYYFGTLGGN